MATHSSILAWRIPWTEEAVYIYTFMFTSICETRSKSERTHTRLLEGALWTLGFAGHFLNFYFTHLRIFFNNENLLLL